MKISKYIIAMLLVVMMLVTSIAVAETDTEGNLNLTGLPIVNEPETIRIVFCKHDMDSTQNNLKYAVQKAAEETNVLIEWEEIPQSDFAMKVSLMFASGDLPDMFLTDGGDSYVTEYRSQLLAVDELLPKYAPELWKVMSDPDIMVEFKHEDGHVYSIPSGLASNEQNDAPGLFIYNKQYFEEVGYIPTNVDELYTALQTIKANHPDVIPLSTTQKMWAGHFSQLCATFGIRIDPTAEARPALIDGICVAPWTDEKLYACLEYYNKLYAEGLYDADAFTQTFDQYISKGYSDQMALFIAAWPNSVCGDPLMEEYEFMDPIASPEGVVMWPGYVNQPCTRRGGIFLPKTTEKAGIVLRLLEYINSSLEMKLSWYCGEEGKDWIINEETGLWHQLTADEQAAIGYTPPSGGQWTTGFCDHGPFYLTVEDCARRDWSLDPARYKIGKIREISQYFPAPEDHYPNVFEDPKVKEERAEIGAEILSCFDEFCATSVVNGITEASWKEYLKRMDDLGVEEYVELWQKYYDTYSPYGKGNQ